MSEAAFLLIGNLLIKFGPDVAQGFINLFNKLEGGVTAKDWDPVIAAARIAPTEFLNDPALQPK